MLRSVFLIHTDYSQARFEHLRKVYADPMTEVYLMFYQATLQIFVKFNKFLQREDPIIRVMLSQMNSFLKKLFGMFVKVSTIKAAEDICSVSYDNLGNQLPGTTFKQLLSTV